MTALHDIAGPMRVHDVSLEAEHRVTVNGIRLRRNPYLVPLVAGGRFAWHLWLWGSFKVQYVGLAYGRVPQSPDGRCNGRVTEGELIAHATAIARWIRIFADIMLVRIARESTDEDDVVWATTAILECKKSGKFSRLLI